MSPSRKRGLILWLDGSPLHHPALHSIHLRNLPLLNFFNDVAPNEIWLKYKNKFMRGSYFLMFRSLQNNITCFFLLLIKSSAYSSPFYRQHPSSIRISPCGLFTLELTSSSKGAFSAVARLETSGGPFFANPGVVWEGLSNVIIEVTSGDSKKMKIQYCLFQ